MIRSRAVHDASSWGMESDEQPVNERSAAASDVVTWLQRLGLGKYAELFVDNEITFEALPHLTESDLKELGLPLGPRRVVAAAIAGLHKPHPAPEDVEPKSAERRSEGERRQLTVMFCDLVGSTALSRQVDPEILRDILRAYQNAVAGEVARFEGHVAKFMGDGVLAYFGWPAAHENEAERAIRSGLAIIDAVSRIETPIGSVLASRIGIATGLVVVGELVGDEEARERAVVGETPNLAARLQGMADPGAVVVAQLTRQLVGDLFEFIDLGPTRLKGFDEPVHPWIAVGEGRTEGRFEALRGTMLPLIGRDHELGMLMERWHWAIAGEGQVVLLSGEPGIGKSRLTQAFRDRLLPVPHTRLRFQCSPFYTNAPLYPVIEQLNHTMCVDRGDSPQARLDKLEILLAQAVESVAEVAPLFAGLLSIPTEMRYPPLDLTPQRQKEETFKALIAQLAGLSRKLPVAMIWEDLHWLDPTSLEFLDLLVDAIRKLPVLMLCTFRPEFRPGWIGVPHITTLTLNRLGRQQTVTLAHHVARGRALPSAVLDQIVEKTDGVPLFIEELTRAILESGVLRESDDQFALDEPLQSVVVPSSLHDSLMARLDRLESTKMTAQIAATIGRGFSYDMIHAVSSLDESNLRRALAELVNSELVMGRGVAPAAHYMFKHALVQDAAYESLLRGDRQALHAKIGDVYETQFPELVASQPELLAHHFTRAAATRKATHYWLKAGERALARSANKEAISHLRAGISLLNGIESDAERLRLDLDLHLSLVPALLASYGYSSKEVAPAASRALDLCRRIGNKTETPAVLWQMWLYEYMRGNCPAAAGVARELIDCTETDPIGSTRVTAHTAFGLSQMAAGNLIDARRNFEAAIDCYEASGNIKVELRFGMEVAAVAYGYCMLSRWLNGFPAKAAETGQRLMLLIERVHHPYTYSRGLFWNSLFHALRRDWSTAYERADRAVRLAEEHGFAMNAAAGSAVRAAARAALDPGDEAIIQIRDAITRHRQVGALFQVPYFLVLLADALLARRQWAAGLSAAAEAMALVEETEERSIAAEIYRVIGDLHMTADEATAEQHYQQALSVARSQNAHMLELRAAGRIARLWMAQGREDDAQNLLAPICRLLRGNGESMDLQENEILLSNIP